jgi:flagellar basal body-associated protein FliL
MRNQKGITLVALVITIIVLLILAGVSISLVVGQNGVLTRATNAVSSNKASSVKQAVSMGLSSIEMEYYTAWTQNQAVPRTQYYTLGKMATELKSQSYTLMTSDAFTTKVEDDTTSQATTMIAVSSGSVVNTTLYIQGGSDKFKVTVKIEPTGTITWGDIQIYDSNSSDYVTVTGI